MRRALIIATANYEDRRYPPLPGAEEDADRLEEVLSDPRIGDFEVTVLRDAGGRAVAIAVEEFFAHADPGDTLLLCVCGHGETDDDGHLYFINHDTTASLLNATALSAHDVNKEMRHSAARAIIVLLDTCYSGAFVRGNGSRGRAAESTEVLQGRGRVVLTASTAVQLSYGVFLREVADGLRTGDADTNRDGFVDTHELFGYVRRRMSDRRQEPTYFADIVYGPIYVARNPASGEAAPFPELRRRSVLAFSRPRKALREFRGQVAEKFTASGPMPRRLLGWLLAGCVLLMGCGPQADSVVATDGCPTPTQLRIAVDASDQAAYTAVAEDFERYVADQASGCRSVHTYLFPMTAEDVTTGLVKGWASMPHPDLWLPDVSRDVQPDLPGVQEAVPVARTPLVLGVPAAALTEDDEVLREAALPWPQLFEVASRPTGTDLPGPVPSRGWGVVRGDPTVSTTAQLVTAKLYAGRTPSDIRDDVERWIEQRLDTDRYPLADEPRLLCHQLEIHLTDPAKRTPAVVLTEQDLVRFNRGLPEGGCVPGAAPGRADRLEAFYPAQTPVVTKVAVRLRWPATVQSEQTSAYGQWLVNWLGAGPGRSALQRQGLRTASLEPQQPITAAFGARPDWPFGTLTDGEATAAAARRTAGLYADARRPGQFLVALDTSGSMNTVTADPTFTRYEVAVAALRRAAGRIGPRDQLGVITFSGPGATPPRTVVGFTRPADGLIPRVDRLAAMVGPGGDTPLYEAVRRGAAQVRGGGDRLRALVVLTDGRDTSDGPPPTAAQLAGVRVYVVAVGVVTCADPALRRIARDSGGACYDAHPDALETVLSDIFRAVWAK